jgi:hypothetical protein
MGCATSINGERGNPAAATLRCPEAYAVCYAGAGRGSEGLSARALPLPKATCGNIDVALPVDGVLLPSPHSGPAAGRGEPA